MTPRRRACVVGLLLALLLGGATRPLAADELTTVRWPGNQARSVLYDAAGRLTSMPAWQPGSRDRVQISGMLDVVPVLGTVKMGLEALTGRDRVGGTCLSGGLPRMQPAAGHCDDPGRPCYAHSLRMRSTVAGSTSPCSPSVVKP